MLCPLLESPTYARILHCCTPSYMECVLRKIGQGMMYLTLAFPKSAMSEHMMYISVMTSLPTDAIMLPGS